MEPSKDLNDTNAVVDLIDKICNKGAIILADIVIHVAGVPLIGINLRAAIAGIETMLKYGMMEAWDESIRKYYAEELEKKKSFEIKKEIPVAVQQ